MLEESPLDVDPMAVKGIRVWGTLPAGGILHVAAFDEQDAHITNG